MIFSALVVFFALPFAALVVLLFCFHRLGMKISELQTALAEAEQVQGRAHLAPEHPNDAIRLGPMADIPSSLANPETN